MPKTKKMQPMLAKEYENSVPFPLWCSKKIDGIRGLRFGGQTLSRSWKPIPNNHIQSLVSKFIPEGLDFEITSGETYYETASAVMSVEGEPEFTVWVFDYFLNTEMVYEERIEQVNNLLNSVDTVNLPFKLEIVESVMICDREGLEDFQTECIAGGFEGVMLRKPNSPYKYGRSTVKQGFLLKMKSFCDSEAIITGFVERMRNENELEEDEFGYAKRSSSKEGKVPAGTLGALLVYDPETGWEFSIGGGKGMDDELRLEIWNNQDKYIGKLVKYAYMPYGTKDSPRLPKYLGFRHPDDM